MVLLYYLFLIFVARFYHGLAKRFQKQKFLYAILGGLTYFVVGYIAAFGAKMVYKTFHLGVCSSSVMDLTAIVVGSLVSGGLYYALEQQWSKKLDSNTPSVVDRF